MLCGVIMANSVFVFFKLNDLMILKPACSHFTVISGFCVNSTSVFW